LESGLLQLLPVSKGFFPEISVNFLVELPTSNRCCNLWLINNYLSKITVIEAMAGINAEDCAKKFLECWVYYHGLLKAITSNHNLN